tara:strand:+ start:825 stop:1004 length:180 start_codon:yes stop_codon:yes gene_type:complete
MTFKLKKLKDTKLGKFFGVGQGEKRKANRERKRDTHNRHARKTEGSRLTQSLRRKFNKK